MSFCDSSIFNSRVMRVGGSCLLFDVRGCCKSLHDNSSLIPSWRWVLGWRYTCVMVTLAHLGQIPTMGIHISIILRFSLVHHPFHKSFTPTRILVFLELHYNWKIIKLSNNQLTSSLSSLLWIFIFFLIRFSLLRKPRQRDTQRHSTLLWTITSGMTYRYTKDSPVRKRLHTPSVRTSK